MRIAKNVTHAAQVALALFTDVADEYYRPAMADGPRLQRPCGGDQRGHPGPVVGNAGTEQLASLAPRAKRGSGGKHGIEMRCDRDELRSRFEATSNPEHVAHPVEVDVFQRQLAKTLSQPGATFLFSKGRGRNARQLQLPIGDL